MGTQADSSMAAWWGRQFDRIYCFHHTGMKGRYEAMRAELERVGIPDADAEAILAASVAE